MMSSSGATGPTIKAIQNHNLEDRARARAMLAASGIEPTETTKNKRESQSIEDLLDDLRCAIDPNMDRTRPLLLREK
jgi:hypothetical protein